MKQSLSVWYIRWSFPLRAGACVTAKQKLIIELTYQFYPRVLAVLGNKLSGSPVVSRRSRVWEAQAACSVWKCGLEHPPHGKIYLGSWQYTKAEQTHWLFPIFNVSWVSITQTTLQHWHTSCWVPGFITRRQKCNTTIFLLWQDAHILILAKIKRTTGILRKVKGSSSLQQTTKQTYSC